MSLHSIQQNQPVLDRKLGRTFLVKFMFVGVLGASVSVSLRGYWMSLNIYKDGRETLIVCFAIRERMENFNIRLFGNK